MSHIHNLLRDCTYRKIGGTASPGWRSNASIANDNVHFDNDAVVHQTTGVAEQYYEALNPNTYNGSGLLMSQPVVDDTPYRVKLHAAAFDSLTSLFIGYGPSAPTGADDIASKCSFIPLQMSGARGSGVAIVPGIVFDEVIMIQGLLPNDPDFQKPIAFGVLSDSSNEPIVGFHLSVQNLAKTAPQFAASMS